MTNDPVILTFAIIQFSIAMFIFYLGYLMYLENKEMEEFNAKLEENLNNMRSKLQ